MSPFIFLYYLQNFIQKKIENNNLFSEPQKTKSLDKIKIEILKFATEQDLL
jgi:hypothetical protein